jgi:mannosyltransferase OCH1-like enzyme
MTQVRTHSTVSTKIPTIIHQIWIQGQESLPGIYRTASGTWRNNNPGWHYTLWDDQALRGFMAREAPEWLAFYDLQPEMSAKADIGRYALMLARGGLYADMDTECVRPVTGLLGREASIFVQVYDRPWPWVRFRAVQWERIVPSVIASVPAHPIWSQVLTEIERKPSSLLAPLRTGPGAFWPVVKSYAQHHLHDICFWDHRQVLTAFYLPRAYMRWYGSIRGKICVLDFNDGGRKFLVGALRRPHHFLAATAKEKLRLKRAKHPGQ